MKNVFFPKSKTMKEDLLHFFAGDPASKKISKENPVSFVPSKNLSEQSILSANEIRKRYDDLKIVHKDRNEDLFEVEQEKGVKCYDVHIALILVKADYLPSNFVQ